MEKWDKVSSDYVAYLVEFTFCRHYCCKRQYNYIKYQ